MENQKSQICILCSKRTKPNNRRSLLGPNNKAIRQYLSKTFMLTFHDKSIICNKCRCKCYKSSGQISSKIKNPTTQNKDDPIYIQPEQTQKENIVQSPKNITLPMASVSGSSHSTCCVCKKRGGKLINVPTNSRYLCLIEHNIIIPAGSRCCPSHIKEGKINTVSVEQMKTRKSVSDFNRTELHNLIKHIREMALKIKTQE